MESSIKTGRVGKGKGDKDELANDGLTDKQRSLEQEKLFREAREQYDQEQMAAINNNSAQLQQQQNNEQQQQHLS
jgi:hypothetical protein